MLLGELPESMDTVPFARQLELVEVLDGISDSLLEATSRTRLGAKKQEELRVRMRKLRRRLGKLLGC